MRKVTVHIIRHGKTELNEKNCYIGVTDESLSNGGRKEIEDKVTAGTYPEVDMVFVSPLKRAIETAGIIYKDAEKCSVEGFMEMDFGSLEGKSYEELSDNICYRRWIDESCGMSEAELSEKYGELAEYEEDFIRPEDKQAYIERNVNGFMDVLAEYDYRCINKENGSVAIVAHGGTVMAIASVFTGEDYYSFQTGCGNVLTAEVKYIKDDNGHIDVSCFSIDSRIHS